MCGRWHSDIRAHTDRPTHTARAAGTAKNTVLQVHIGFNKDLKMSQCVEREEEGSDRPESPPSSCVSMKSDWSKGKPPEPGPSHTQTKRPAKPTTDDEDWDCRRCGTMNTAEDLRCRDSSCYMTKIISTSWDSITALPLSAADMRTSWHKDLIQSYRDFHLRCLVWYMSAVYPAEDLVTEAQNIERNIYESANSYEEYCELVREKLSELMEKKLMRMGTGSITALPLSAADMRKSWHKGITQIYRDYHVRLLVLVSSVEDMSTGDPAEDIKDLVTDDQNIERNSYESANSRAEYFKLINEKRSELRKKSQMKMEKKQSSQMEMKSMDQTSTPPLPPGDKKQEEEDEEGGAEGGSKRVEGQPDVKMEDKPEGTIPLHCEMEDHPVTESQSSLHPSLELQDETDLSSCFSGLSIEESISLPRSHSLPSLSQIPCLENKTSFRAKRSHSVNDVTLLDKTQKITPDIIVVENEEIYSFHCTQAGLFQCNVTDLVFKMKTEGDVTYRTVHWDRRLLAQLGTKRPAGPLFDIKGSQGSVCQLRFPHCEILSMGGGKSLSVLHVIDDDSFELIKPHLITETHVIIDVTGLSLFSTIIEKVSCMMFGPSPVQALVSLFYTPPIDDDPSSILKVLLLPGNVVQHEVMNERRKINGEEIHIEAPPCKLIPKQEYTLSTSPQDDSIIVLPNKAEFEVDALSYHNYRPTFIINLEKGFSHVRLLLSNSKTSVCEWEGYVKLSAAAWRKQQVQHTLSRPAEDRLFGVRSSFINSVSDPVLKGVLDELFQKKVIIREEYDNANVKQVTQDKARFVIDAVRNKGTAASSSMILFLCESDPFLSKHLGLM